MLSADDRAEAELGSAALRLWLWACSWTSSGGQDFWAEARFAVTAPQPFPTSTGSLLKTHCWTPPLKAGGNETGPRCSFFLLPWEQKPLILALSGARLGWGWGDGTAVWGVGPAGGPWLGAFICWEQLWGPDFLLYLLSITSHTGLLPEPTVSTAP